MLEPMVVYRNHFAVALFALALSACVEEVSTGAPAPHHPDLTFTQVRLQSWRASKQTLTGTADHVTFSRSTHDVGAQNLSLHSAEGEQLQVAQAHGNPYQKLADAWGGARMSNAEGLLATGPSFHFSEDEQGARWLTADAGVKVHAPGMEISAPAVRANLDTQHLSFTGGVGTQLTPPR